MASETSASRFDQSARTNASTASTAPLAPRASSRVSASPVPTAETDIYAPLYSHGARVGGFGAEGLPASVTPPPAVAKTAPRPSSIKDRETPIDPELVAVAQPSPTELTREAIRPMVLPALYGTDGRLLVPAALRGSREVLVHQNLMADEAGLERIRDDEHLARLYAAHQLLPIPESFSLRLNPELPLRRRSARAWTVRFAVDTARAFYDRFHQPLQVNSAVRTVAYQLRLQRSNGNAAAVAGDTASPHLTGQAIDFGKRGMSLAQIAWMRGYLLPLMETGEIDVEEEFQQACFHISVYRSYLTPQRAFTPKMQLAQTPGLDMRSPPASSADQAAAAAAVSHPSMDEQER